MCIWYRASRSFVVMLIVLLAQLPVGAMAWEFHDPKVWMKWHGLRSEVCAKVKISLNDFDAKSLKDADGLEVQFAAAAALHNPLLIPLAVGMAKTLRKEAGRKNKGNGVRISGEACGNDVDITIESR